MIFLKNSVRCSGDHYQEVQSLVRKDYLTFDREPNLIERFKDLSSNIFTFVTHWNDPIIPISAFHVYSKKLPSREALRDHQNRIRLEYQDTPNNLCSRLAIDKEKSRYSHEWIRASHESSLALYHKCKASSQLLFSIGAIFECTFNAEGIHSQSQRAILFDLPTQDDVNEFKKI